jgi:hypothetical protein
MRSCDGCTLCCKVIGVQEFAKPRGVWCKHCKIDSGCTIHETRPEVCRAYSCRFLLDETLDESWRPSRSGMVINADRSRAVVYVDPDRPGSWLMEPFYSRLKHWSRTSSSGWPVFVCIAERVIAVHPGRDVEVDARLPAS